MSQEIAIALSTRYHLAHLPDPEDLMRAYRVLEEIMVQIGIKPTFFTADEGKLNATYKKYGGRLQKRFVQSGAVGFRSLGFAATPESSDAPAFDNFFEAYFSYTKIVNEVSLSFVLKHPHRLINQDEIVDIITRLAVLWPWDYGFSMVGDSSNRPGDYLTCIRSNFTSLADERRLELWYNTLKDYYSSMNPPRRLYMVRDVFPFNIIGPGHLAHKVTARQSLHDFILNDPDSTLSKLSDNLWLWSVKPNRIEEVRRRLRGKGILVVE